MKLEFVKVKVAGKKHPQKTLREDIFKHYFEELGYTRKMFTKLLGLNHRVFTVGLRAFYTNESIELLRAKKIVNSNIGCRVKKWKEKLEAVEVFIPGFTELFKNNIKSNPVLVLEAAECLLDDFYRAKIALRPIRGYANQALVRLKKQRKRFVANGLEARFKFILEELSIEYECQYKLSKYYYDFRVGKTLIEVDGKLYHKNNKNDKVKDRIAKKNSFTVLRISDEFIKKQPIKLRKCLLELNT